jgi:hypothetical protein
MYESRDALSTTSEQQRDSHRLRGGTGVRKPLTAEGQRWRRILRNSTRQWSDLFSMAGMQDKQKSPPAWAGGLSRTPTSARRVTRLNTHFSAGRAFRYFSFRSTEASHGVGTNAPEDRHFCSLGLLGFPVLPLVLGADEQAVHEDVIALVEGVSDGLAEAVESHDAVPLGFRLPLFVRVFPRLLGGDGQDGEVRTVAADLPFLRIFSEEADELNVIQVHFCFSFFAPFPWGTQGRSGYCSQGEGLHSGRDPKNHREEPGKQKTRSCRAQELSRSRAQGKERRKRNMDLKHSALMDDGEIGIDDRGSPVRQRNTEDGGT